MRISKKMLSRICLIISLGSLCLYLYGFLNTLTNVEDNLCKMTYMYEYPQYVKILFKENSQYPKYGLYAYSEGHLIEDARMEHFTGAPVLFIPGNSGSFKQVRSLASVALRKGLDRGYVQHIDFFAVDLNEEYSGLFGGVLNDQSTFVQLSITKILDLYKNLKNPPKAVLIIGHSMGGKIAQSLLLAETTRNQINTIITLGAPMDEPVVPIDFHMDGFYKKIDQFFMKNRNINQFSNKTNFCENIIDINSDRYENNLILNDVLIITIGGGSRDIQVHPGLTSSKYADINTMATAIPNVWLTTDHLCAVWCLELTLVTNRFLFSILKPQPSRTNKYSGQSFIEDKSERLSKAKYYFKQNRIFIKNNEVTLIENEQSDYGEWMENSKRIFSERFKSGTNRTYIQMISLKDAPQYKMLYAEVINLETSDWVFGCAAIEVTNSFRYCSKALSLTSQYTKKNPSQRHERNSVKINLHNLKKMYPKWTHVLLRFLPTKEPFQFNIDIHNPIDREINFYMPKWYSFSTVTLIEETLLGSKFYTLNIKGMDEPYQTIELNVQTKSCSRNQYHSTSKVCVPWADGTERYHYFTETKKKPMYIYVPKPKPGGYNSSLNPVKVELNLDPNCRYTITVQNSLGMTMSRIVQQYSHWLPAHLVAILLLAFKHQITLTPINEPFKCGTLHVALIKCSSFFIITASRVFVKILLWATKFVMLPNPDPYDLPIILSIIVHGASLALLTFATGSLWATITFFGNIAHKLIYRLIKLPIPTITGVLVPIIQRFPITIGVLLISIAFASCGGVSLILASIVYFILLSKMYEDYLEEFVFKTAKQIALKLFGKYFNKTTNKEETENENENDDETKKKDEVKNEEANIQTSNNVNVKKDEANQVDTIENEFETIEDAELDKLFKETLAKQKQIQEQKQKEAEALRVEYDSIHAGLSNLNYHLPLFFLLVILTILNIPSAITWAKNYQYATILKPDPSLFPTVITLLSLCVIWQLPCPRNLLDYRIISSILYVLAVLSILYCQQSVFRLNAILSTVFSLVSLHQIFGRKYRKSEIFESPEEIEIRQKIEELKNLGNLT